MHSDQVLFLFLPIKLLTLKFTRVLDLLALILETLVRQIVNFLDVVNILLALVLCMIIYFEGALRSHEVWICLGMIIGRYLLAIQCQTYYSSHVVRCVVHTILYEFVQPFVLSIQVICCLIEPIHILLTL